MVETARILIVDDEPHILQILQRALRAHFDVTVTTAPEEALRLAGTGEFAVLVADQSMPGMDGVRVLEQARTIAPDTLRIMLTGRAEVEVAKDAINRGAVYRFLTKPWDNAELVGTLQQAVRHYGLEKENRRLQALTREQAAKLEAYNEVLTKKVFVRTRHLAEENRLLSVRFRATVEAMAELGEAHGPTFSGHVRRVTILALAIGRWMKLPEDRLVQLELAALLHDAGKIGRDPALLARGDEPEARAALRDHALAGAALVQRLPELQEAARSVRHQQEHYDGTGYPDGLVGEEIPLGARILAVVDAFDTLLNRRDAFGARTAEDALEEIRQASMRRFDPEVVTVLSFCLLTETQAFDWDRELEIPVEEAKPGMIIARDLRALQGALYLPAGSPLEAWHLARLAGEEGPGGAPGALYVRRPRGKHLPV